MTCFRYCQVGILVGGEQSLQAECVDQGPGATRCVAMRSGGCSLDQGRPPKQKTLVALTAATKIKYGSSSSTFQFFTYSTTCPWCRAVAVCCPRREGEVRASQMLSNELDRVSDAASDTRWVSGTLCSRKRDQRYLHQYRCHVCAHRHASQYFISGVRVDFCFF